MGEHAGGPIVIAAEPQLLMRERAFGFGSLGLGAFCLLFLVVFGLLGRTRDDVIFGLVFGSGAVPFLVFGTLQTGRRKRLVFHPAKRVIEETGGLFAEDRRKYHALGQFGAVNLARIEIGLNARRPLTCYRITLSGTPKAASATLDAGTYRSLPDALDAAIRIARVSGLTLRDSAQEGRLAVLTPERARAMREDLEPDDPWWRRKSVIALVLANLIPAVSVLVGEWDGVSLIIVFWAEGWILGFYTLAKILTSAESTAPRFYRTLEKALWLVSYVILFVPFVAVLWIMIVQMFALEGRAEVSGGTGWLYLGLLVSLLRESGLWMAVAALFASHGVAFASDYLGKGEYRRAPAAQLAKLPFWHMGVVQFVVVFGAHVISRMQSPGLFLALLVLVKTAVDIRARVREHRRFSAAEYDRQTGAVNP